MGVAEALESAEQKATTARTREEFRDAYTALADAIAEAEAEPIDPEVMSRIETLQEKVATREQAILDTPTESA